jgi:hypothetical protein
VRSTVTVIVALRVSPAPEPLGIATNIGQESSAGFAFRLILLGALAWKAPYAPACLGAMLVVAGAGYAVDALR